MKTDNHNPEENTNHGKRAKQQTVHFHEALQSMYLNQKQQYRERLKYMQKNHVCVYFVCSMFNVIGLVALCPL